MKRIAFILLLLLASPVHARTGGVASHRSGDVASFYGFESGTRTASGEHFNPNAMTCAHRTLPFGTMLRVTYAGRSVVVRVNDRGPAKWTGRGIDLSLGAARAIGLTARGFGPVTIERL